MAENQQIRFVLADGDEVVKERRDDLFGVTCLGLERRWAENYKLGDYLASPDNGSASATPGWLHLIRITSMTYVDKTP